MTTAVPRQRMGVLKAAPGNIKFEELDDVDRRGGYRVTGGVAIETQTVHMSCLSSPLWVKAGATDREIGVSTIAKDRARFRGPRLFHLSFATGVGASMPHWLLSIGFDNR